MKFLTFLYMRKKVYNKTIKKWFIIQLKTSVTFLFTFKFQLYDDLHNS